MSSPMELARIGLDRSVRLGLSGSGTGIELYVQSGRTTSIKVFQGAIESLAAAEPRGLGVRMVESGRVGYAYTGDLSPAGIDGVLLAAADNARAADPDVFAALPPAPAAYPEIPGLWEPGVSALPVDAKAALALEAEAAALAEPDIELVEESQYADSDAHVAIVSSEGVAAETRQSFCLTYLTAHAARDDDRQSGLGFTLGRDPSTLQPRQAGIEAASKARVLLGASPCPTGRYTVVLTPEVAAAFLAAVAGALSADAVQKGRSVFAGRLGEQVAATRLRLWDDGLAAGGLETAPFDGEGVPSQHTPLIEDGLLRSYLYDSYTARKAGPDVASTGNGGRGSYRSLPAVGLSNLVLSAGMGGAEEMLRRVGSGLLVESVAGIHSGINPATGEISVGLVGRLIEAGEPGRPVREVTLATDFLTLLRSIDDIAGDARWIPLYGSVYTPSLAVVDVAVSGS